MGTSRPRWNAANCFCAECLSDAQCGAGEVCDANGTCRADCARCSANTPGVCGAGANVDAPYCVAGCCAECLGNSDCGAGEVCFAGACGQPQSCTNNPNTCPQGYVCQSGTCRQDTSVSCIPNQPNSCPAGEVCDANLRKCVPGGGCGMCNPDCTCDGGLICNGLICEGCTDGVDPRCPGASMFCFSGVCLDI